MNLLTDEEYIKKHLPTNPNLIPEIDYDNIDIELFKFILDCHLECAMRDLSFTRKRDIPGEIEEYALMKDPDIYYATPSYGKLINTIQYNKDIGGWSAEVDPEIYNNVNEKILYKFLTRNRRYFNSLNLSNCSPHVKIMWMEIQLRKW